MDPWARTEGHHIEILECLDLSANGLTLWAPAGTPGPLLRVLICTLGPLRYPSPPQTVFVAPSING